MRTIKKRAQPDSLTEWRAPRLAANRAPAMECSYEEMRRDACLVDVEDSLFTEQGGICAYTGQRLKLSKADPATQRSRDVNFHIEHLTPQEHCSYGEDSDYRTLVACWPRPNCGFEPAYGARKKDNWPTPQLAQSFVSPLRTDCTTRFAFDHRGGIAAAQSNDAAAAETIRRLGLDHENLAELRRHAIQGALSPCGPLTLADAKKLLATLDADLQALDAGRDIQLMAFCFAIRPALSRRIRKLEGIRASQSAMRGGR